MRAEGDGRAQHGYRNEVTWEGGSGRQPYSNRGDREQPPDAMPEPEAGNAGDTGNGTGGGHGNDANAGSADKNGKSNKGKGSGGKLAGTGDGSGIAAGLAAAAVATTAVGAAMLVNDRENSEGASE